VSGAGAFVAGELLRDAGRVLPDAVELRRRIHHHPELGLELPVTQATIVEALRDLDLDVRTGDDVSSVVADLRGAAAAAAIPKIEAAVKAYQYGNAGDYRIWPGPNSNTFVAAILRAIPEAQAALPANAVGRDFRPLPYVGLTDSRTGVEASLLGVLGIKLGWVEGVEFNLLGLVAGLDLRNPGIKLPGFGHIGLPRETAVAEPAR
jgi:hypothetical protein